MIAINLPGIELKIDNAQEILRMGGPYVGDLYYEEKIIARNCLVDSFVYRSDLNCLFYVQYHKINYYQHFTINFKNLINSMTFQFESEFEMVYINEFVSPVELEIFLAFHNNYPKGRQVFNIDDEAFYEID